MDETSIKIKRMGLYLYRAIDSKGDILGLGAFIANVFEVPVES